MTVVAIAGKFISAWLFQKNFRFTKDERSLIFGLTNSQAAATLAAVLVGYNIIIGNTDNGEPIRLLNESILNGTIVMILITCTIASFVTQRSAQNVALSELSEEEKKETSERILIPVSNPKNIDDLVNLGSIIKSKNNREGIYSLNIITEEIADNEADKSARKLLEKVEVAASGSDIKMKTILRYDTNVVSGISNTIKEYNISDLLLGLHIKINLSDTFFGKLTEGILSKCNCTTYIYRPFQPISTIKRHLVIIPGSAENEAGFSFWLSKIWHIAHNTGAKIIFYSTGKTNSLLVEIRAKHQINADFHIFDDWGKFKSLRDEIKNDDNVIIVLSRKNFVSYNSAMDKIPMHIDNHFQKINILLIYPSQSLSWQDEQIDLTNPSLLEAIEKVDLIGKTIASIFRKK